MVPRLRYFAFAAYPPGAFFVILPFFVPFVFFVVKTLQSATEALRWFRASGFFAFAAYPPGAFFVILPFFVLFVFFVVKTLQSATEALRWFRASGFLLSPRILLALSS
jgi:hypothetical protein